MLARTDSAGASHKFVDALVERGIEFCIGMEMRKHIRLAILALVPSASDETITSDCEIREGAEVAELNNLDLSLWPVGTGPSSDEKSPTTGPSSTSLTRVAGGTRSSSPTRPMPTSPTSKPAIGAMPEWRTASVVPKTPGCATCLSATSTTTPAGSRLICLAQDLFAFTQGLVLEGELAQAEPKRLRYALLHTAGRLTTSSRRTTLRATRMALGHCTG